METWRQKGWFDKKDKERVFEPGQQVMLLLPTLEINRLAQWQLPFKVLCNMGPSFHL